MLRRQGADVLALRRLEGAVQHEIHLAHSQSPAVLSDLVDGWAHWIDDPLGPQWLVDHLGTIHTEAEKRANDVEFKRSQLKEIRISKKLVVMLTHPTRQSGYVFAGPVSTKETGEQLIAVFPDKPEFSTPKNVEIRPGNLCYVFPYEGSKAEMLRAHLAPAETLDQYFENWVTLEWGGQPEWDLLRFASSTAPMLAMQLWQ